MVAEAKRAHSLCTEDKQNVLDDVFGYTETVEHAFSQEESITVRMVWVKNTQIELCCEYEEI